MATSRRTLPTGLVVVGKETLVPLKDVSVKAQLNGYLVGLDSILKYSNEDTAPIEVVFRFPVDESFAVVGLEAVIAGRKIKAQIREKEEARRMYDDALASGFSAALAEESSGDVFSVTLGNLPPKTDAELHLKLVGELPIDAEGGVCFSLPSVLKPRYTPAGSSDPLASVIGEAGQVKHASTPGVFNFSLEMAHSESIAIVTSPTHGIKSEVKDNSIQVVTLAESKPLDQDLVIQVFYKNQHEPKTAVEKGIGSFDASTFMGSPAVMLSFFPKFESPTSAACEFIFLVDRSGSMHGAYITRARETLILFLKSLPPGCSFNILGFGSRFESLFPNSVPYNQENLDKAVKHTENIEADFGGTELLPPLKQIFQQATLPGLPRQVFVLTDGSVSNTHACIEEVKRNVQHSRVFTFGIGSGASTALVKGLARAGNGTAEFIKEGERMQPKVISSLKRALQPSITDIQVQFELPEDYQVIQAPHKPPVIFNGDKIVIYGVISKKSPTQLPPTGCTCKAVLKGQMLDNKVEFEIGFQLPGDDPLFPIPAIHHLAAKSLIKDWQDGYGLEGISESGKKDNIVKLSVESSVVSSHTAYIAVDEEQDKPIEGAIKTWDLSAMVGLPHARARKRKLYSANYMVLPQPQYSRYPVLTLCCCSPDSSAMLNEAERERSAQTEARSRSFPIRERGKMARSIASTESGILTSSFSPLTTLVSLQQITGAWELNATLAEVFSKSLGDLEVACPVNLEGIVRMIWATVLALVFLEIKHGSQRDEWELVAMKSEQWLQGQTLPTGVDLHTLRETARKCL